MGLWLGLVGFGFLSVEVEAGNLEFLVFLEGGLLVLAGLGVELLWDLLVLFGFLYVLLDVVHNAEL